jgi:hypothetical protein
MPDTAYPNAPECDFARLTDEPYMKKLFARIDAEVACRIRAERELYRSMGARTMGEVFGEDRP